MVIHGSCPCGNIACSLVWEPDPAEIHARACGCSFCTKHGGVWASNPSASLKVVIEDASRVSEYAFGTRTAQFHVCARCGVVPVVTSRIDDRLYAIVSANAFEGVEPALVRRAPASCKFGRLFRSGGSEKLMVTKRVDGGVNIMA